VKQTGQVLFEAQRSTEFKSRSHYLLDLLIYTSQIPHGGSVYPELEVVCISNNADRSIYFDDFRFHPMDASFTSFVYDQDRCLLTHTLDGDNYYTRYEYDDMGRLVRVFQEIQAVAEKKVSEQIYNYGSK
jgi:YD repeat-containing protein